MEGLKKFVIQGMMPKETIEQRVRRLKGTTMPGVMHTSLDLYYNDLNTESMAYTARLEMWLTNGTHYRTVHARCASFAEALDKIQEYEAYLIAGKKTTAFEVYEGKIPSVGMVDDADNDNSGHQLWPFETRAEFTTFVDVISHFGKYDKKGDLHFAPQTVADLPRLRHGMALLVHLPKSDRHPEWIVDWFDYASLNDDGKTVRFVCINDCHAEVYPLDPYSVYAIFDNKPLPKSYSLWLSKTRKDVIHALKASGGKEYRG